jgi:gas vesicle protein
MNQQESGFSAGTIFLSFFAGGLIGAGVALLTAPKTGEETRKMIKEFGEEAKDKAEDYVDQVKGMATAYVEKGKDFIEKEKNVIAKAVEAGKEAYEKETELKVTPLEKRV